MLNVHVRIVDSVEKKSVAARLRISDDTGRDYPPLGRVPLFACGIGEDVGAGIRLKGQNFYPFSGKCEIPLPAGVPLRIQAVHGPEFFPCDETVTLGPGQLALRIAGCQPPTSSNTGPKTTRGFARARPRASRTGRGPSGA